MTTLKKIQIGWKYRRLVWKYRRVYRRRRELTGVAVTGAVLAIACLMPHRAK